MAVEPDIVVNTKGSTLELSIKEHTFTSSDFSGSQQRKSPEDFRIGASSSCTYVITLEVPVNVVVLSGSNNRYSVKGDGDILKQSHFHYFGGVNNSPPQNFPPENIDYVRGFIE